MDIGAGDVIVIIGGWFVIGFLVALVLGKILREANELGSESYQPSERDNAMVHYFRPRKHPAKLRMKRAAPTRKTKKKGSKQATA